MTPKDDETSLGAILLELDIITPQQLQAALDRQANSTIEQLLGMILVHDGACTKEEVELALSAQKSMRNGNRDVKKAVAVLDFAIHRKKSNGARDRAVQKAAAFTRSQTGQEYQAVTASMLAKRVDEG